MPVGEILVFDVDGTIAESCQKINAFIWMELNKLMFSGKKIILCSGSSVDQIVAQLPLSSTVCCIKDEPLKFYVVGSSGSECCEIIVSHDAFGFYVSQMNKLFAETISNFEEMQITSFFDACREEMSLPLFRINYYVDNLVYIYKSGSMTMSCLGREADRDAKNAFDPSGKRRSDVIDQCRQFLPLGFRALVGGTTSIDVVKTDKCAGVQRLLNMISSNFCDVLFFGDKIDGNGNDSSFRGKVLSFQVSFPDDTLKILKSLRFISL